MGRMIRIALAFLAAFVLVQADVTGEWEAQYQTPLGPQELKMYLTQEGPRISGHTTSEFGEFQIRGSINGADVKRVKEFYDRGGRYMSLAHNGHNQLADSHTGESSNEWKWGGVSPLGREVIQEMNRLGMMVDVSHPSKGAIMQAIALSKAPVIASHSSVRRLANQSRNMDDELLTAVKTNGGVVQINAVSDFVKAPEPRPAAASGPSAASGRASGGGRRGAEPAAYKCPIETAATPRPAAPRATVKDYVDHIDYAVKLIGIDHVGIASDFDGGGGVDGWNSAAEAFDVTLELVRRGYTEEQIGKIWSGNLLRVWGDVEKVARSMR